MSATIYVDQSQSEGGAPEYSLHRLVREDLQTMYNLYKPLEENLKERYMNSICRYSEHPTDENKIEMDSMRELVKKITRVMLPLVKFS